MCDNFNYVDVNSTHSWYNWLESESENFTWTKFTLFPIIVSLQFKSLYHDYRPSVLHGLQVANASVTLGRYSPQFTLYIYTLFSLRLQFSSYLLSNILAFSSKTSSFHVFGIFTLCRYMLIVPCSSTRGRVNVFCKQSSMLTQALCLAI